MTGASAGARLSLRFADFEEQQQAMSDWDQQYFRMAPGAFEGGIDLLQVGAHALFRERWSVQFRYQGTTPAGTYAFALPVAKTGPGIWIGQHVHDNSVIVQAPGQEADLLAADAQDYLVLSVPADEVQTIFGALSGHRRRLDAPSGVVTLKTDVAAQLRAMAHNVLYPSHATDDPAAAGPVETSFQQLLPMFVHALFCADKGRIDDHRPGRSAEIVRQATDFVLANPLRRIGLVDICTGLGVSLRALHYAFSEVTGMTAAAWLRTLRLNRVHKALVASSPIEVRVKSVAIQHGFVHLGHFGQQYQRLFGCLPSDTLYAP